MSGTDT